MEPKMSPAAPMLKKGYTTGVHALIAFQRALEGLMATQATTTCITHKMENDDLDVTKGCEIVVCITFNKEELVCNSVAHRPYEIGELHLFAGEGVGVVTKAGLKPPLGYPAINPVPLEAITSAYEKVAPLGKPCYATIGVTNGEQLAKQTANAKVGVVGGISILGTTGWVKPVSSSAYLDSIEVELKVAKSNGYTHVALTLGNSSLAWAKEHFEAVQIIEIGNFVYDALALAKTSGIKKVTFVCGIGKAVKVMQGHKNTHNRFGQIDFASLRKEIAIHLGVTVDTASSKTVKGIVEQLDAPLREALYGYVAQEAQQQIQGWFPALAVEIVIVR